MLSSTSGGQVDVFTFSASGSLTPATPVAGPPSGVDLAVSSVAHRLYAADFDNDTVYGYSFDPSTGALSPLNNSPYAGIGPAANGGPIAINPAGTFLFHSNAFGAIGSYSINSDGSLTVTVNPVVSDCASPLHLLVSPSGKFLYVPNNGTGYCVYSIDPNSGALTLTPDSPFIFTQTAGPWALAFGSGGAYLYSTLSNAEKVDGLSVDANSGDLAELSGSPYPAGFDPQGLAIGGNGNFLYAGNRGDATISIFNIDPTTGVLSPNGTFNAGNPAFLAASPSGAFLFAFGVGPGPLTAYGISSTGALSALATTTISAGSNLPAVTVVTLSK